MVPWFIIKLCAESDCRNIYVFGYQTRMCSYFSWCHLGDHTHLKLLTGKGMKYRRVDVVERVWVVDHHKCWGLTGLYNLCNVDWARTFVDITKTTWIGAYMKLYDDDSAMHQLFQISWWQYIPIKLVNGTCHIRSRVQSSLLLNRSHKTWR